MRSRALVPLVVSGCLLGALDAAGDTSEVEPNDVCPGGWYSKGTRFHGAIAAGDVDWVAFYCAAGDLITMGTEPDGGLPTVDTVLELFASDCTTMLAFDDDRGPGLYSLIDGFEAPYGGVYYLNIRGFHAVEAGNYVLQGEAGTPVGPGFCPLSQYDSQQVVVNLAIPDGKPNGLETPPITFEAPLSFRITDVVVSLEIEHEFVGDLTITLKHTSASGLVKKVQLVQQPEAATVPCSGRLVAGTTSEYSFRSDPVLVPIGEVECPATVEGGCYAVSPSSAAGLDVFDGQLEADGEWTLLVTDDVPGNVGWLHHWSVHVLSETGPVSVEAGSWGTIKARYR